MSNNKFHKILSDTITLPLLPADKFNETNIKINSTDNIKLIIRVIEKKYTQTT